MTTVNSTTPTTSTTGTTATPPSSSVTPKNSLDKDAFLKLLVAQLKYQDPSSPADSSQFMAQTAQFTQLEAIQTMQKDIAKMTIASQSSTSLGMIGKSIVANGANTGDADITGTVTSVRLGTDGPVLKVGDMDVPLSSVKEVNPLKTATTSTTAS